MAPSLQFGNASHATQTKDDFMRKSSDIQRFPQSALLFRFCFRVLETRKRDSKIHDQEVGNILQYNPSDTSHWKRGKKAVRSVYALEALAEHLDIDLDTIQDICDGTLDFDEAWFDYVEAEEDRKATTDLTPAIWNERRNSQLALEKVAANILVNAHIQSVPVYLPEVLNAIPFIQVVQGEVSDKIARSSRVKPGQYSIRYRKGEMRAHTRCAIAREIARVILFSEREQFNISSKSDNLSFFEIVDLSNALLVPTAALRSEVQKVSNRVNMVKTLADVFWVSKSVIRARLAQLVLEDASESVFTAAQIAARPTGAVRKRAFDLSEDDTVSPAEIFSVTDSSAGVEISK